MAKTIVNQTTLFEPRQINEALALAAITPGDLVELTSAASDSVQRNGTAAALSEKLFAMNNDALAGDLDTDYATGERVRFATALPGDVFYAWLADTIAVTKNTTLLISNGDGSLKAAAAETGLEIIAIAAETVTASGKTRVLVRAV